MLTGLKVITLSFPINFKYMAVLNLDKKKNTYYILVFTF